MVSETKLAANRANAQLSTGPQTAEGKAAVALNPVRHGIFATVPVLPTEDPDEWDRHRAPVVESLGAAGGLEIALAERAALVLWRLGRLARYEAAATAAGVEDADLPPVPGPPPPPDPFTTGSSAARPLPDRLREVRRAIGEGRERLAALETAGGLLTAPEARPAAEAVTADVAHRVLSAACEEVADRDASAEEPEDAGFLRYLKVSERQFWDVDWTFGLVWGGLAYYAAALKWDARRLADLVAEGLGEQSTEVRERLTDQEAEAEALETRIGRERDWKRAARCVLADPELAKVQRYESHLVRQLQLTLDQLRILQANRAGCPAPPPATGVLTVIDGRED
jgi:hypothetical protein